MTRNDKPAAVRSNPIVIEGVRPQVDGGRYPTKREVGDLLEVWAQIYKEGHDLIAAVVRYRPVDEEAWTEVPMHLVAKGIDGWIGHVPLERNVRYRYTIEAWADRFGSWAEEIRKKIDASQDVRFELIEGRDLVQETAERTDGRDRRRLQSVLERFDATEDNDERQALLLSADLRVIMDRWPDRSQAVVYDHEMEVIVDRVIARFAAWYEIFPRSQATVKGRSGTFSDCEKRLPEIRDMGFDVIYLTPIHPIGRLHRKGPNNSLDPGPEDPGSPYAIGAKEGGHTAIHPDLGTLDDFRGFVRRAGELGMEVALDIAIQCAPDHPWIEEHPEWFIFRPDGSIKYAENPPKKYQDIVNLNFYGPHREALWNELKAMFEFWIEQGVTIFRVDNPHTKPVPFWEWVIGEIQRRHPGIVFLAEAFTRPPMLRMLAKVGFSQSYTYFTWRNFKPELIDFMADHLAGEVREFLRPNLFPSTPDILPEYLQTGGRPAFVIRLVLAATLSSVYGIYGGFELCEAAAVPGTEEYRDSEKYQYKTWDWNRPGHIKDIVTAINRIRRDNPALYEFENIAFHPADDDHILFYGKTTLDRSNMIFVAVNLDPFDSHEATLTFPLAEMGVETAENFTVEELLSGRRHIWSGANQMVRLDPNDNPVAIFRVTPWRQVDYRSPCY